MAGLVTDSRQPDTTRVNPSACHFFARQPILGRDNKVFGYELLFRAKLDERLGYGNPTAATRSIIDSLSLVGFDILCDGTRAFLNCTEDIVLKECVRLLPPDQTVVEILETVIPDPEVMAACQELKRAGYMIALDNFSADDIRRPMVELANIIKIDFQASLPSHVVNTVKHYGPKGCRILAQKIESPSEFAAAKEMGCSYFQGFFFRKPESMTATTIPVNRANYVRLLQAASWPELEPREIENLIKSEPSFCYRLLRYLNSATFGFSCGIHSIRHALSLLGDQEVRRWIRLVAMVGAGQNKTSDLVLSSLVRARFCELLASKINWAGSDLFLLGLLSLIDSILDIPMPTVLESVRPAPEIREALLGGSNRLQPLIRLMIAMEGGDWRNARLASNQILLSEREVSDRYWQAMQWAREVNGGIWG